MGQHLAAIDVHEQRFRVATSGITRRARQSLNSNRWNRFARRAKPSAAASLGGKHCFRSVDFYHAGMLTTVAQTRREFLRRHSDGAVVGRILEIGAFDNPTFRRELGDQVEYLDFFSREELVEMHKGNPRRNPSAAVEVDHVVKSSDFSTKLKPGFDLIVAHHVMEHVPDVIFWFQQIERLLAVDGWLFLSIPDRRYTFDFFRPISLATQMIRAHAERLERPDVWQLTEAFYYYMDVDLAAIWRGKMPEKFVPRFSLAKARQMAESKSKTYTDAHCWVFTSQSFTQCVEDLRSAELLQFSLAQSEEAQPGTNEFRVLLRR